MEIQKQEIWEELYRERTTLLATKKERITQQEIEFFNANKTKLVSEKSEEIIGRLKNSIFTKLFSFLDSDGDNEISADDFGNGNLPPNILRILEGISQTMKQNNDKLILEQFLETMRKVDLVTFILK